MSDSPIDQARLLAASVGPWLNRFPLADRLEPLADVHSALRRLEALVKGLRDQTLSDMVDAEGLEVVSSALGISADRLLGLIADVRTQG